MIVIDVRPYCHNCSEFKADVKKIEIMHANNKPLSTPISNTIISCKYRNRCEEIKKYLMNNLSIIEQFKEENNG